MNAHENQDIISTLAVINTKVEGISSQLSTLNDRINKREAEIDTLRVDHFNVVNRIAKIETTVDILKMLVGGALTVGVLALVEGFFDLVK